MKIVKCFFVLLLMMFSFTTKLKAEIIENEILNTVLETANVNELNNNSNEIEESRPIVETQEEQLNDTDNLLEEDKNQIDESNTTIESDELTSQELKNNNELNETKVQLVKVVISKLTEDGELLIGAKLQILDKEGNVIDQWISENSNHEVMLSDGEYTLHEVEAPEGYELAADESFIVKVELKDIIGNVEYNEYPCEHYGGTPLYYVEVESISYEVYCINQNLEAPDGVLYNGEIIKADNIRDFTKQTISTNGEEYFGDGQYGKAYYKETIVKNNADVSDQSLSDQELYDKVLNIIYHRQLAPTLDVFKELTESEIRFITEYALKNYLNAGVTGNLEARRDENDKNMKFEAEDGKTYYLFEYKELFREYAYDPTTTKGYRVERGNGSALGHLARHWYSGHGKTQLPQVYVDLYNYLISDEEIHPENMQLYIYTTDLQKDGVSYQNLLGITGYIEQVEQEEQKIEMVDKYSNEKTNIKINKIWKDNDNQDNKRPNEVEVILYADDKEVDRVILNEENNWEYVFENLDVYNKGKKITYRISETNVPYYKSEIDGYTITNTYEVEKRNITVKKIWDDKDNYNKLRPKSIIVNLYANGVIYESIELNGENNWEYVFENLDVYKNGTIINYTVDENEINEYSTEIKGNMEEGFQIINIIDGCGDGEENPQTSDNIILYIIINLLSVITLILLILFYKKIEYKKIIN